jgi:hypothetical protein
LVYINVTSFSTVTNAANLHFSFFQRIQRAGKLTPVPFTMLANSKSSSYLAAYLFPEADVSFITVDALATIIRLTPILSVAHSCFDLEIPHYQPLSL